MKKGMRTHAQCHLACSVKEAMGGFHRSLARLYSPKSAGLLHTVIPFLGFALFAVFAPNSFAAITPGAIPGSFSVSESGAASYSIPIAVPPGTAGMEPKLALNYSSQGGNGLAGVGWSLGGLSAITRCPADPAPYTSVRVGFTSADRFCLDGQKLVVISGTYGASGAEYRTERESFVKIVSNGTVGSGPAWFQVWTKGGLIMEFGNTADSQVLAEGKAEARVWALNKISDTSGNYLTVGYLQDTANAAYVPSRIDYTGNANGLAPYNRLDFSYETRPDVLTGYIAGVRIGQTQRLTHIIAVADGNVVSDYTLAYDTAPVTKHSRISTLTRCAGNGDCLAPTQFDWSSGELASYAPDAETVAVTGSTQDILFALGDLNADGKTDALLFDVRNSTFTPYLAQSDSGLVQGTQTGVNLSAYGFLDKRLLLADTNGDGTADPSIFFGKVPSLGLPGEATWSASTGGVVSATVITSSVIVMLGGDGVPVFGSEAQVSDTQRWITLGETNADGRANMLAYFPNLTTYGKTNQIVTSTAIGGSIPGVTVSDSTTPALSFFLTGEVTGDGLTDTLRYDPASGLLRVWQSNGSLVGTAALSQTIAAGGSPLDRWFLLADINGDGLGDLILHTPATGQLSTWLAKGDGTFVAGPLSALTSGGLPADTWLQMVDINSDGRADAVKYNPASGQLVYALSLGNGDFDLAASIVIGTGPLPTPNIGSAPYTQWFSPADVNGDGVLDWVRFDPASGRIKASLGQGGVPDQLTTITDGLGADIRLTYKPLTDTSVYTKGTGAAYPTQDIQFAMQVVSETASDDGIGGSALKTYFYAGAQAKVDGGGFLGFKTVTVTDVSSGIASATEYRQDSPYTGLVSKKTQTTVGGTVINLTTNTYNAIYPVANLTVYPYLSESTVDSFELNGTQINRVLTKQSAPDAYGNAILTGRTIYATAAASTSTLPIAAERTISTYVNDAVNWRLGRVQTVRRELLRAEYMVLVTVDAFFWSPFFDISAYAETRTSAFAYGATNGLLTQEIIEPDQPAFRLVTDYLYDAYGNKTKATVSGGDAVAGTSFSARSTVTAYDSKGRFPLTVTNAMGHRETRVYDERFGLMTGLTGPNLLTTAWAYDGFGRKTLETRADATQTTWSYADCDAACPGFAKYSLTAQSTGVAPVVSFYDALNRAVRSVGTGFDGQAIYADTEYDNQGRVKRSSRPYFANAPVYWTTPSYDELGRTIRVDAPDGTFSSMAYNGLTSVATNPKGQTKTELKNSLGQTVSVTDNAAGVTTYAYDPFGNLIETRPAGGGLIQTGYDLRGRKISSSDPDMGAWSYAYNALGELIKQTDARAQVSTLTYDLLGRIKTRTEPGMSSTWTYDNAANGKGKLARVVGGGVTTAFSYDSLGRPTRVATVVDSKTFNQDTTYDSLSRVLTQTRPSGFATKNLYNASGYQTELRNADVSNALLWKAVAIDAEGRITQTQYGNGVVNTKTYQAQNGRLTSIQANAPNGVLLQNQSYTYDRLGNLDTRADPLTSGGSSETFQYDSLNRLTQARLTQGGVAQPAINLSYSANGNILSKTGVGGVYTYHATQLHAVVSAGGNTYAYDANGNLTGGGGRALTWTSWNMPEAVTYGGATISWSYDADHVRIKQVSGTKTTYYLNPRADLGGHYEEEQYSGGRLDKIHGLYAGGQFIGQVITTNQVGVPTKTRYFHSDHLGSISAVSDEAGAVVARYSYDAWGKRQIVSGKSEEIHHGYTGHEHLDDGFIHMNGRLYDPVLGRFISADPYIQDASNGQGFNRYSYVLNNPFYYTDPTGFSWWTDFRDKWLKPIVAAVAGYFTFGVVSGIISYVPGAIAAGAIAGGAVTSLIGTGSLSGWQYNSLSILAFSGAGLVGAPDSAARVLAHAVAGCVSASASGGACGPGALSAGFSKLGTIAFNGYGNGLGGLMASMVIGGTASVLGGGKFENGAATAAFGYLYNCLAHECWKKYPELARYKGIIEAGNIDWDENLQKARNMSIFGFYDAVKTGSDWDYKGHIRYSDTDLLQEFGNFHFGAMAAENGFSLTVSLFSAGTYQTFKQNPSVLTGLMNGWNPGSLVLPNIGAATATSLGYRWGDNPGDSSAIQRGWMSRQ